MMGSIGRSFTGSGTDAEYGRGPETKAEDEYSPPPSTSSSRAPDQEPQQPKGPSGAPDGPSTRLAHRPAHHMNFINFSLASSMTSAVMVANPRSFAIRSISRRAIGLMKSGIFSSLRSAS